jgi:hypothetical protein
MTSKARIALIGTATLLLGSAFVVATRAGDGPRDGQGFGRGGSEIQRGLALSPVKLNLHGKNRDLVALGSYIVNAQGGCNDCHSCPSYEPGHSPYTGGDGAIDAEHFLAGGVPFGPFVSRNLTPDDSGRPAGLSLDEFMSALRTGHDPDNPGELLQVMPWPIYGKMTDRDLKAVYEYLSAIPHAESGTECGGGGE